MAFPDTLLKISRKLTDNEMIALLEKNLKDCEFEKGILKSEVAELKDMRHYDPEDSMEHVQKALSNKKIQFKELETKYIAVKKERDHLFDRIVKLQLELKTLKDGL